MGPPAKELFELLLKTSTKTPEVKVPCFNTINYVIKSGHMMQNSEYVIKTLLKISVLDKETKELISVCLPSVVAEYPSTCVFWQNLWPELMQAAIKELDVCESVNLMTSLMQARLNECKLQ